MLGVLTQPFYLLSKPNSPEMDRKITAFLSNMQEKTQKNAKLFAGMPKMLYLCTLFLNEVRLLLRNFLLKKGKCHEVGMTYSTLVVIV